MAEFEKTLISSGLSWEPLRGYSRAVIAGNTMYISGTTAMDEKGDVVAAGDPYEQTKYILHSIKNILQRSGFQIGDVVRTRLFVTNLLKWEDYARAHREVFENVRPASSIVQVVRLTDPRLLIEIEAEAVKGAGQNVQYVEIKPTHG